MKVLHAADFHLDSPLAGLPADKSALRRRELRDIPARLARLAREANPRYLTVVQVDRFYAGQV